MHKNMLGIVVCTCHPSNGGRKTTVQASLDKKWDPIFKVTRAKRVEGMAQAVERLPSKCEALSSNSSTTPLKKPTT
jgi:hypothetical protein